MSGYEVPDPILNSPFEEPVWHWDLKAGEAPQKRAGRRPAGYFYRDPKAPPARMNIPRVVCGKN
jgi:type III restriction enzyme